MRNRSINGSMLQRTSSGIAYDVTGHGPPVLLLHAGIGDHRMWDAVADLLVATRTVVRPDLRGFGASPAPDRPFRHIDDVRDVLVAAGFVSAAVVGNSFGGRVALSSPCLRGPRRAAHHAGCVDTTAGTGRPRRSRPTPPEERAHDRR